MVGLVIVVRPGAGGAVRAAWTSGSNGTRAGSSTTACSRQAPSTGSAPTSSAATSMTGSSGARGSRFTSSVLVSVIVVPVGLSSAPRSPAIVGGLGRQRADARHRHLSRLPAPDPGPGASSPPWVPGSRNAVIAIAFTTWSPYARIARAEALTIRNSEFILAARMQGASTARHPLSVTSCRCACPSVIVRLTLDMAGIILTAAGLGFLGLGAQPPTPEWGAMISTGRQFLLDQWWVPTVPGHRDLRRQPGLQPARRRAARRARSEERSVTRAGRSSLRARDIGTRPSDVLLQRSRTCWRRGPSRDAQGRRRGGARRELRARAREARHRRRVRLRQVPDRPRDPAADPTATVDVSARGAGVRRHRSAERRRAHDARAFAASASR